MAAPVEPKDSLTYAPSSVSWSTATFVARPPSITARIFVYLVALLVLAGVAYAHVRSVAISVDTRGLLVTKDAVSPVRAPAGMKVAKLLVKDNQRVERGDVLIVSEDLISEEDVALISSQKKLLDELLAQEQAGACEGCLAKLKSLANVAFKLDTQSQLRQPLSQVRQQLLDFVANKEKYENFGAETAATRRRIAVAEGKLKEIRARNAEAMLAMQVEQLTSDATAARSELAERKQTLETQLQQARNGLTVRAGEVVQALELQKSTNTLLAPASGIVNGLSVAHAGEFIGPGTHVCDIIPADSGLEAEMYVANKDISQVKPGMKVQVKLDALPEREYGVVEGVIDNVDASPANADDPKSQLSYKVRAKLFQQSVTKAGVDYPFRLGMSFNGAVISRYESLLMMGMKKLFNITDDLFK